MALGGSRLLPHAGSRSVLHYCRARPPLTLGTLSQTAQAWAIKLLPQCGAQAVGAAIGERRGPMDIITRKEAKARGLPRYFTGEPCKHGHVAERQTSSNGCFGCVRERNKKPTKRRAEAYREYCRKFQEANPHMPQIISKVEAKARGLDRYFTAKPCKNGHIAERNIGGVCITCAHEYHQQYRKENEEHLRKHKAEYHQANAEHIRAKVMRWVADNPERHKENLRRTYEANPGKFKARAKQWAAANPDKMDECRKNWRKNNTDRTRKTNTAYRKQHANRYRAFCATRRARRLQATPAWLTDEHKQQMADIHEQAMLVEELTGIKHHVDHIEPLQGKDRCGLHVPWNLQILTATENLSKHNRPVRHVLWKKP